MLYFWLCIGVALTVEAFIRLGFLDRANRLTATINKSMTVLASGAISDHWKAKVLPRYSIRLLVDSLTLFALMLLAFLPITVIALAADATGEPLSLYLASWTGILVSSVIAMVYVLLRKRLIRA